MSRIGLRTGLAIALCSIAVLDDLAVVITRPSGGDIVVAPLRGSHVRVKKPKSAPTRLAPRLEEAGLTPSFDGAPTTLDGDPRPARPDRRKPPLERAALHGARRLGAVPVERVGTTAVLEVADTGIGIAPDDLKHVYTRFWRGERSVRARRAVRESASRSSTSSSAHTMAASRSRARPEAGSDFGCICPQRQRASGRRSRSARPASV